MADLRGGSTIGGRPIATSDMISQIISQEQIQDWTTKMNRCESSYISIGATIDSMIKDTSENGLHQIQNLAPTINGYYNYGTLANLSTLSSRFQMYAPHKSIGGAKSSLLFRTGWDNDIRDWEEVAVVSDMTTKLGTKFDKAGGTITGATTITAGLFSNGLTVNNTISSTVNGNTLMIGSINTSYSHFSNSAAIPFHFNRDVKIAGDIYAGTAYDQKVWHAGNFTPNNYIAKSTQLANLTDLNTVITEGQYRAYQAINRPTKILNWAYVEVIAGTTGWVLQKIYNFEGSLAYMRTLANNIWTPWIPLGGASSAIKLIAATTEWTLDSTANSPTLGLYSLLITHNLGYDNVVSVVLTDSANMSMAIGFEAVDANKTKIWCGENPTGKVVINVTP